MLMRRLDIKIGWNLKNNYKGIYSMCIVNERENANTSILCYASSYLRKSPEWCLELNAIYSATAKRDV